MKVLFHLVSGQNMPSYIASKTINPDKNIFFTTDAVNTKLSPLRKVLKGVFVNIDAWDFNKIKETIKSEIDKYKYSDELILNFTGGTKIMSIAAFQAFREKNLECVYVNTEQMEIIKFLHKDGEIQSIIEHISVKGTIEDIITLNNEKADFGLSEVKNDFLPLYDFLKNNYSRYEKYINKFASSYRPNNVKNVSVEDGNSKGTFIGNADKKILIKFVMKGVTEFEQKFLNNEVFEFLNGKWFEHACYEKIQKTGAFNELKMNVTFNKKNITGKEKFIGKNEIDIYGLDGIYPVIFECKAGNVKAEAIDKLVAVAEQYIGRYTDKYLITFFPLNYKDDIHKILLEKLEGAKIKHIVYSKFEKEFDYIKQKKVNIGVLH